jgi:hypothetical protein
MCVEHAKVVAREKLNAQVTSQDVAIAGRRASFAAILTVKERSQNGQ